MPKTKQEMKKIENRMAAASALTLSGIALAQDVAMTMATLRKQVQENEFTVRYLVIKLGKGNLLPMLPDRPQREMVTLVENFSIGRFGYPKLTPPEICQMLSIHPVRLSKIRTAILKKIERSSKRSRK